MTDTITFEHPLNERCRTLLRLSHLFEQFAFHTPRQSEWDSRAALGTLLDIAAILARADIKSDLLKEMDRYRGSLDRIAGRPGVDSSRLNAVLKDIRAVEQSLRQVQGQLGQSLRGDEFLTSILQRSSIPGGNCNFDLPQYHFWLNQPHEIRQTQMSEWMQDLLPVREAVVLLLNLVRNSNLPTREQAAQGFFQRTLESQAPAQMLRVGLPRNSTVFTEISGNKHRFSIRFLEAVDAGKPLQTDRDVDFLLTACIF